MAGGKSELERLLDYFQSETEQLDMLQTIDPSRIPGLYYISMITYEGVPILPPVMTPLRREEMLVYKRQAVLAEARIRAQARQRLLLKVQTVMDEIEKKHGKGNEGVGADTDTFDPGINTFLGNSHPSINRELSASNQEGQATHSWLTGSAVAMEPGGASGMPLSSADGIAFAPDSQDRPADQTAVPEGRTDEDEISSSGREADSEARSDQSASDQESSRSSRSQAESEKDESKEDWTDQRDDSDPDMAGSSSQGLLLLKKKLEERSEELLGPGSRLVLSSDNRDASASATSGQGMELAYGHCSIESSLTGSGSDVRKENTVAKRLPTFLRIQESLSRKLNSGTAGLPTSMDATTVRDRANSAGGSDVAESSVTALAHPLAEGHVIMQKLASMTLQQGTQGEVGDARTEEAESVSCASNLGDVSGKFTRPATSKENEDLCEDSDALGVRGSPIPAAHTGTPTQDNEPGSVVDDAVNSKPYTFADVTEAAAGEGGTGGTTVSAEGGKEAEYVEGNAGTATSTSNSLASGNTFGSDEMNRTVISQEESKSRNTTVETVRSDESIPSDMNSEASAAQRGDPPSSRDQPGSGSPQAEGCEAENEGENPSLTVAAIQNTPPHDSNKENRNPKLPLLSRVALNVDLTPDCTPHKGKAEQFFAQPSPDTWITRMPTEEQQVLETMDPFKTSDLIPMELAASPGPTKTPNLSTISFVDSEATVDRKESTVKTMAQLPATPGDACSARDDQPNSITEPFVKSVDTHEIHTHSTELAPYMATSVDTLRSSLSTLPHGGEDRQMVKSKETGAKNVQSGVPLTAMANGRGSDTESSPRLRGSYTLDHPSPALIAAHPQDISECTAPKTPDSVPKEEPEKTKSQLTSSMEDLRIRPVHRKLDYASEKRDLNSSATDDLIITPLPPENEPAIQVRELRNSQGQNQGQPFQAQGHSMHQSQGRSQRHLLESHVSPGHVSRSYEPHGHVSQGHVPQGLVSRSHVPQGHLSRSHVPLGVLGVDEREAERTGKEAHLQRYLDNLSQMPSVAVGTAAAAAAAQGHVTPTLDGAHYPGACGGQYDADVEDADFEEEGSEEADLGNEQHVLQLQQEQFEQERQQLLEEQRLQLVQLMEEQDKQQLIFKQRMNLQKQRRSFPQDTHARWRHSPAGQTPLPDAGGHRPPTALPQPVSAGNQQHGAANHANSGVNHPASAVNQHQLLASLVQLLGAHSLGGSLNPALLQGLSPLGQAEAGSGPASVGGYGPGSPQAPQLNTVHGYPSFPNTTVSTHSTEYGRSRTSTAENQYNFRPDSQLSSASTVTSQNVHSRPNDPTVTSQSIYSTGRDGTVSQASTLPQDYLQRPFSAPVGPVDYLREGDVQSTSPAGPAGVYYSPSAIAKLLSQAGLNISFDGRPSEQAEGYSRQRDPRDEVCKSPAVLNASRSKNSPLPLPLQSVFSAPLQRNAADTSIQSSERSVHFAPSPMHVTAHEGYAHHGYGDISQSYSQNISIYDHYLPPELSDKFKKLTALIKGYLTRRLLKTEKVQGLIKSISDTAEFALRFQQESPIKRGVYNEQDRRLQERIMTQLNAHMYAVHDLFISAPAGDRMEVIRQDRQARRERMFKSQTLQTANEKKLSAATVKSMGRKQKAMLAESSVPPETRPKSAPPPSTCRHRTTDDSGSIRRHYQFLLNRALKPLQSRTSPIKPLKSTNRVQHKDPNIKTAPRKTHVQVKPGAGSKTKAKQAVTSTAAKKTSQPAKQPVRKIARHTTTQGSDGGNVVPAQTKQ